MIAWMLYSIVVAAVIAGAGRAAESLARVAGYRMRWIWIGALALTAFLSVSSAVQRVEQRTSLTLVASVGERAPAAAPSDPTWIVRARFAAERVGHVMDGAFAVTARSIDQVLPSSAITFASLTWLAISTALAALFIAVIYRFQRARRHWPRSRVHDVPVRVSPSVGPFVIGLVRPEIVVPRWLLHRADDEQRLAVAHEQEHLNARDPLLLGIGWAMLVLAPWNAGLWYMVSRLRLAIELDCDARVLRRGVTPRAYGSLLIEVAQNSSPLTLSALGLADESSQLYHRILALRAPTASFARTRVAFAVFAAVSGVLVACRIAPPPQSTPAPSAPTPPTVAVGSPAVVAPVASTHTVARVEPRQRRARVATPVAAAVASTPGTDAASPAQLSDSASSVVVHLDSVARRNTPLILIDGVRSTMEKMRAIDPKTIDNVEVLKGPAAIDAYGVEAERGVITITTKAAPPPPF